MICDFGSSFWPLPFPLSFRPALYGSPSGCIGGVLVSPSPAVPSSPGSGTIPHSLCSPNSSSRSSLEASSPLSHLPHHLHHGPSLRSSQADLSNLESNWKSGGACPTNGSHQLEHHPEEFGAQNTLQQQQHQQLVERAQGDPYSTDYASNTPVHGSLIDADTINNPNAQNIISHSSPGLGNSINNTANMMDTNCNMNMTPLGHPTPHGMGGGLHGRTNGVPGHHFKEEPVYGPGGPVVSAPGHGHSDQGLINCSANNGKSILFSSVFDWKVGLRLNSCIRVYIPWVYFPLFLEAINTEVVTPMAESPLNQGRPNMIYLYIIMMHSRFVNGFKKKTLRSDWITVFAFDVNVIYINCNDLRVPSIFVHRGSRSIFM